MYYIIKEGIYWKVKKDKINDTLNNTIALSQHRLIMKMLAEQLNIFEEYGVNWVLNLPIKAE